MLSKNPKSFIYTVDQEWKQNMWKLLQAKISVTTILTPDGDPLYSAYILLSLYLQYIHLTETLSTVLTSDGDPGSALSGASVSMSSYTVIVLIFSLCVLYSQHVSVTFRCDRVPTSIIQLSTSLEPAVYEHDNVKAWPCVRSYYVCGYYKLYAYGDDNAYDNNNRT